MVQERRGGQRNVKFLDAGRARRLGKIEARGSLLLADEGVYQALWRSAFVTIQGGPSATRGSNLARLTLKKAFTLRTLASCVKRRCTSAL